MQKLFENWRRYLTEQKEIPPRLRGLRRPGEEDRADVPRHRQTAWRIIDQVKQEIQARLRGPRREKLINLIHRAGQVNLKEATLIYDRKILPILLDSIDGVHISLDQIGIFTPGAMGNYFAYLKSIMLSNEYLWAHSNRWKDEKERWEEFEDIVIHELGHHLDAIWASDDINYPGKPDYERGWSARFKGTIAGFLNLHGAMVGHDHYATKPSSISAQQMPLMQDAYKLVLKVVKTGDITQSKSRGRDKMPAYHARAIEAYQELQVIIHHLGELKLDDLLLICRGKGKAPDGGYVKDPGIMRILIERGWTKNLLTNNDFIFYLNCENLNQKAVNGLNMAKATKPAGMPISMVAEE